MGVNLPPLDADCVWKLEWRHKKALYGKKHLIAVGGKTVDDKPAGASGVIGKRTDTTVEPVCFHPFPATLYEDILHGFFVKLVYDLTPADDTMAWVCLQQRTACISICYTDLHAELLHDRLIERLKVAMGVVGNPLYNATYAVAIGGKTAAPIAIPPVVTKKKGKAPKDPKGPETDPKKPKGKKKGKTPKDEDSDADAMSVSDGSKDDEVWDPLAD